MSDGTSKQRELFKFPVPEDEVPRFKDFLTHYAVLQRDVKRDIRDKGGPKTREEDYLDIGRHAIANGRYGWKGRVRQDCARKGIREPTESEFRKLAALLRREAKTKGR